MNKFTREEILKDFRELEMDLEGNLQNMNLYLNMDDNELKRTHKEMLDAKYDDSVYDGYRTGKLLQQGLNGKEIDSVKYDKTDKIITIYLKTGGRIKVRVNSENDLSSYYGV